MPVHVTYPGVYIEEIPSGVRTITGVATSITAFLGRAARGPRDEAVPVNSFADFERTYGGLWRKSRLGYAVRDFFLNGGSQAIIVRLYRDDPGSPNANPPVPAPASKAPLTIDTLPLQAASEGTWGVYLRGRIDTDNLSDDGAQALGLKKEDLFNLTVRDTHPGGKTERFVNLTTADLNSPRFVTTVLASGSDLVEVVGDPPATTPKPAGDALTALEDALAEARKALQKKQIEDPAHTDAEKQAVDTAKANLDKAIADALAAVSDGLPLSAGELLPDQGEANKKGLFALEQADLFNLLVIPPYAGDTDVDPFVVAAAAVYCEKRRAMLLVDSPSDWNDKEDARQGAGDLGANVGTNSRNAALFFPRLKEVDPLKENQLDDFAAAGAVAGIMARTDAQRGVWKAPAGLDATLVGVSSLTVPLTDSENGELNPLGVNCLRAFPVAGRVVWGSRTMRGADQLADEYKYIPVRRTALFLEESLYRGLKWVVFEPNDEPLWAQIRLNVGAFMHNLFRQGAFQGTTPRDAYFVKCDKETTTQNDINLGIVNVVVGFAPLKPAEFVIVKIQQMAGQIEV
jgi:Bacteriophage tail sheath protein